MSEIYSISGRPRRVIHHVLIGALDPCGKATTEGVSGSAWLHSRIHPDIFETSNIVATF